MRTHSSLTAVVASLGLLSAAAASTLVVEVGNGALMFKPNSTMAAVGDIVEFHYYPKNHSVTQGAFDTPCMSTSGFFSGFMPTAAGEAPTVFRVTVNDTNPIWFYCSQPALGGHCAHGMVGVINEPASGPDTLAAYAAHAKSTTSANVTNPSVIGGGVFAANLNASTPSSTMASAVSTSATGTSTGTGTGSPSTSPTSGAAGVGASAWMEMLGFGAVLGGWAALAL